MPKFRYVAHTPAGERISGEETAMDEASLVRQLQARDLFVARVSLTGDEVRVKSSARLHKKVKDEDRLYFTREMATLISSGVPFERALDLVIENILSSEFSNDLRKIREDVKAGLPFYKALERYPRNIPPLWSHLVEAGETGGDIAKVLHRISAHLEETIALRKKVVSAMVYPAVLFAATIGALMVFLLFVIPAFAKVFASMNAKLPPMTVAIFTASSIAKTYFIPIAVAIAAAVYLIRKIFDTPAGRRAIDLALVRLPGLGNVTRDIIIARIAINLSAVLSSGVGMIYALDVVSRACGNKVYADALEGVMEDVRDGSSLSKAFARRSVFSPLMIQMVIVGEETGKLPEMIQKIAVYYEARIDTMVARLGTLIEPVILVFLGGVVGVIVVALMYPIVTVSSALH